MDSVSGGVERQGREGTPREGTAPQERLTYKGYRTSVEHTIPYSTEGTRATIEVYPFPLGVLNLGAQDLSRKA